jgi:Sulfotransferase family
MTSSERAVARDTATAGRLPDFFIVGHAKSGTTALYEMLRQHPQIFMPELKEPRFFSRELHPLLRGSKNHPDTLERYMALFEPAAPEQRAGEASPSYLRSTEAAADIAAVQPQARIIAILREPASYVRSLHAEMVQDHIETERDLAKAIALQERRRGEKESGVAFIPHGLMYTDHVRYVEQVSRYRALFPLEQVLVLIYDDFRADNEGTLRRVLRFLEVDDDMPLAVLDANPTVRVRSTRLHGMLRSVSMGRGGGSRVAKGAIKALTPRSLRRKALDTTRRKVVFASPEPPDEELMLELRRRFKPEVQALSEYMERDLVTLWGYDHLD